MTLDPKPPERPKGVVLPGGTPGSALRGIVLPPGADAPAEPEPGTPPAAAPRLVVPPGAAGEIPDDLPEYPSLRPLEMQVARANGREVLVLSDPLGVSPQPVAISLEALPMLQLFDGSTPLNDLCAMMVRETGDLRSSTILRQFVAQLDGLLLLESERFRKTLDELRRGYHALEFRQAAHAGLSYPDAAEPLAKELDRHFAKAERWREEAGEAAARDGAVPRALVAPHIDVRRGGPTFARAYLELGASPEGPLRFVILGTGHQLVEAYYALTRKHFETPFGPARCDTEFVDALAARLGDAAYEHELIHRDEHSIEFQALYLKRRLGDRPFTIVPILFGGFHALVEAGRTPRDEPAIERFIAALREVSAQARGATCFVAGVDLSHVGARFGDGGTLDDARLKEVEAFDRQALEAARRGDADGWFQAIAETGDATRVCGFGPLYALLRALEPGEGRLLRYEQSLEASGSMVSFAALAWS